MAALGLFLYLCIHACTYAYVDEYELVGGNAHWRPYLILLIGEFERVVKHTRVNES